MNRKQAAGGERAAVGKHGDLGQRDAEHKYQLWVFDGCRTQDYNQSIRATPNQDAHKTDLMSTQRVVQWADYAKTFIAFLDSVLAQQSAEQIMKGMDTTQELHGGPGQTMKGDGFGYAPVIQ